MKNHITILYTEKARKLLNFAEESKIDIEFWIWIQI